MKNATLLGIPLDLGAENLGVDIGPNAFRYEKIKEKLENAGLSITDAGNITCRQRETLSIGNPKLKYLDEIVRVSEEAAQKVYEVIKRGDRAIVLGGDHTACLGPISGASVAVTGDLGLIYLDNHGDMNTDKTTCTGNIHGMNLGSLMGFGAKELVQVYDPSIKIKKENLLHIGANDLDPAEIDLIEKAQLKTFKIFDLLSHGLHPLFAMIDRVNSQARHIWVSMDLDVNDVMYAPGAGMPNKAGLTYREITTIANYIGKHCNVIGVDVVEYNPLQDIDNKTAELGVELIAKFLGTNYSWYTNYMEHNKLKNDRD